jgi:transketolase
MILKSVLQSNVGHVATSFSCAEILTALYFGGVLRFNHLQPDWPDRDRFLLSKGHAATGFYCVLAMAGFISEEMAINVSKNDSSVGVHLQSDIPGVEFTSGSLGQGLGLGCGVALAAKMDRKNYITFVLTGDGECNEGSIWESALFAGHHKLNNLVWIIDRNFMQCSDFTENCLSLESLSDKIAAFGFRVKICDGNNCDTLINALLDIRSRVSSKPLCLIAKTTKGQGIPSVENDLFAHHYMPEKCQINEIIDIYLNPFIIEDKEK